MKFLRYFGLVLITLLSMLLILGAHYYIRSFWHGDDVEYRYRSGQEPDAELSRITTKASEIKKFLDDKSYDRKICFLVDMKQPSGKNRFFVYDLAGDSVLLSGLVAHGRGGRTFSVCPRFSNETGSLCTALGRYRVGKRYQGSFGTAYKLYGLDSSNENAFRRNIVLHAHSLVPDRETDPYPICNSSGCPMVAAGFLEKLALILERSSRPVILWIFN